MGKITGLVRPFFLFILWIYQYFLSPLQGPCCRFTPSCTSYARDALQTYSLFYAFYLIFKRICRCHPWCQGGFDPLPEKKPHVDQYA